jgi:hypothetical protein
MWHVDARVRFVAVVALALGLLAAPASAQASAQFASPVSAPATELIWVRSVTPCPVPTDGVTSWVEAQLLQAVDLTEGDVVWGDLRDDGHWDVTLSAPTGPSGGATGRYLIRVQCGTTQRPPIGVEKQVTQKYVSREIEITSGAASSGSWLDGPVGGVATTTTTTTTAPATTTTTAVAAAAVSTTTTTAAASGQSSLGQKIYDAAEIQAEIDDARGSGAADDIDLADLVPAEDDGVAIGGLPAAAQRNEAPDEGIPGWAFLCAAFLAVGAVIAWGARRQAAAIVSGDRG